jgi:hypothetical protein
MLEGLLDATRAQDLAQGLQLYLFRNVVEHEGQHRPFEDGSPDGGALLQCHDGDDCTRAELHSDAFHGVPPQVVIPTAANVLVVVEVLRLRSDFASLRSG